MFLDGTFECIATTLQTLLPDKRFTFFTFCPLVEMLHLDTLGRWLHAIHHNSIIELNCMDRQSRMHDMCRLFGIHPLYPALYRAEYFSYNGLFSLFQCALPLDRIRFPLEIS